MAQAFPTTRSRVRNNTDARINQRIDHQIERNVLYFSANRGEIARRLAELDEEWDVERMIQANAATLALLGTIAGARGSRGSLVLPLLVTGFLLQHAIQGWCPPVPILRRFGFRTAGEINRERYALKALRGDFEKIAEKKDPAGSADAAMKAVNA